MNKFKLGSWKVEQNKNLLTSDSGKEVRIEPLNMALLCYFVQNPGEPINREKLIEDVWDNKIVTDHAVYKTINQLRKYLASDGDTQDYIKTIPKKGYALIAPIEEIIEVSPKEAVNLRIEASSESWFKKWFYKHPVLHTLGFIAITVAASWFLGLNSWWYANQQSLYTGIKPIRGTPEFLTGFNISRDGKWGLLVTNASPTLVEEHALQTINLQTHQINKLTSEDHNYSVAKWSYSGKKIIATKQSLPEEEEYSCNIVILDLSDDKSKIVSEREIAKCSYMRTFVEYDDISDIAYFTYTEDTISPSKIYSYDLQTEQTEILTNPGSSPYGDWSIEISPDRERLAFLRVYENDNELRLLDLSSKEEEYLYKYESYHVELSWNFDGTEISYQPSGTHINAYSLIHNTSRNIVVSQHGVYDAEFSSVKEGVYSLLVDKKVKIISAQDITSPENYDWEIVFDNGASNIFPVFANNSQDIAFNSSASGDRQVWLKKQGSDPLKISTLEGNNLFLGASFSPDDSLLLGELGGKITIIEMETGKPETILEEDDKYYTYPFWWPDGENIGFSYSIEGKYNIYKFNLKSREIKQVTSNDGYAGAVSPDGRYMYFVKYSEPGLWKLDLKSLEEEKVFDQANADTAVTLFFKNDNLYFGHRVDLLFKVFKLDANGVITPVLEHITEMNYVRLDSAERVFVSSNSFMELNTLNYHFPEP